MQETSRIVSVGEACTIDFAEKLGIFDNKKYFKDIILNSDGSNIKVYNNTPEDNKKTASICSLSDDKSIAYQNCAYKYNNPYLVNTVINNKSYCMLPKYINPTPDYVIKNETIILGETSNTSLVSEVYDKYNLKQLCEERWHDWFCIPDYHHGNKYFNEIPSELSGSKSVGTCYTPCPFNYIPRDDTPNANKCIIKDQYKGGIVANTFNYTPLAMICLFGLNEKLFKDVKIGYPNVMNNTSNIIINSKNYKLNNNGTSINIIDFIKDPKNNILDDIWNIVKNDISYNCNKIHEIIPDIDEAFIENNIIIPDENIIRTSIALLPENIFFAYNLAKKIKTYISNINENPLENNYEDYKKWKRDLLLVNPNLTKEKLKLHIKAFKKCCNICFDGKSDYSKNYILYTLKRANNINEPIVFDDIDIDPEDDEIIINTFNIKPKKEAKFFESYTDIFDYIRSFINSYIILLICMIVIMLLYIIYITYYEDITAMYNYIYISILWLYFDLRSFIYYKLLYTYTPDDTDMLKKEYIKKSYSRFIDDDVNYFRKSSDS